MTRAEIYDAIVEVQHELDDVAAHIDLRDIAHTKERLIEAAALLNALVQKAVIQS